MSECRVFHSQDKLASFLTTQLLLLASQAIENKKKFYVGLSGGSVAKIFCERLSKVNTDQASFWQSWRFIFCDERYVAFNHPDSTYGYYKEHFFDKVPVPDENIIKLNYSLPIEQAALAYENEMRAWMKEEGSKGEDSPRVLLLGMGPDGHTCSLFPQHPLLQEKIRWVSQLTDSPKPPSSRITLTLPPINNTPLLFLVACGASKASVIKEALEHPNNSNLPISMLKPNNGKLVWLMDKEASSLLQPSLITHHEL